jgi:hypothetical protein
MFVGSWVIPDGVGSSLILSDDKHLKILDSVTGEELLTLHGIFTSLPISFLLFPFISFLFPFYFLIYFFYY